MYTWPEIESVNRPWTRWWWPGSAVDKANITRLLKVYQAAGLGGVEITSIYHLRDSGKTPLDYLSPAWLEMVRHTIATARELGMQVDLPPGSGWCVGGSFVTEALASADLCVERLPDGSGYKAAIVPTGHQVKTCGPGGGGLSINPYSRRAWQAAADHLTPAFAELAIRAQFHDSWEYKSSGCAELFAIFRKQRGYDFRDQLDDYVGHNGLDRQNRVVYDLQLTLAEMALDGFIRPWTDWCRQLGQQSRNQAHGSPGNLLDLYAAADIPETEIYRSRLTEDTPLISKFASSAAHVAGRPLIASETGTWLKRHFEVRLADLKELADNLFVGGINHVVYHGTAYSPDDAEWPGWLFYATAQVNPSNSIWRDLPTLNDYIARCQALLQGGQPDNDLLVYFPFHEVLHDASRPPAEHLGINGVWLQNLQAIDLLRRLWRGGYGFDFVSDRQIASLNFVNGRLVAPGGNYRALLVPPARFMPLSTLEQLAGLSRAGAPVVFNELPRDVPGLHGVQERRRKMRELAGTLKTCADWERALAEGGIRREPMMDVSELLCIRRRHPEGHHYFVVNQGLAPVDAWMPLGVAWETALIMDPLSGRVGAARAKPGDRGQLRLQLQPGEACLLRTLHAAPTARPPVWPYADESRPGMELRGRWRVTFIDGGPVMPEAFDTDRLVSWTDRSAAAQNFAGTALYRLEFDASGFSGQAVLDLGVVHASARVRLNGADCGTVIGPAFRVNVSGLREANNLLEVEVTNTSINRLRDLNRRGVDWHLDPERRVLNSLRHSSGKYGGKPVDYADEPVALAGLLGPVKLYAVEKSGYRPKAAKCREQSLTFHPPR